MPSPTPVRRLSSATASLVAAPSPEAYPSTPQAVTLRFLGSPEAMRCARNKTPHQPLSAEAASLLQRMCARASDTDGLRLRALAAGGGVPALRDYNKIWIGPAVLRSRTALAWLRLDPEVNLPAFMAHFPELAPLLQALDRLLRWRHTVLPAQEREILPYFYLALHHGGLEGLRRTALAWVDKLPATLTLLPSRALPALVTSMAAGSAAANANAVATTAAPRAAWPPPVPGRRRPASRTAGPATKRTRRNNGRPTAPAVRDAAPADTPRAAEAPWTSWLPGLPPAPVPLTVGARTSLLLDLPGTRIIDPRTVEVNVGSVRAAIASGALPATFEGLLPGPGGLSVAYLRLSPHAASRAPVPAPSPPPIRFTRVGEVARPAAQTVAYVALQQSGLGRVEVPADHVGLLLGDTSPDPAGAVREVRLVINGVALTMRLDHARLMLRTPQLAAAPALSPVPAPVPLPLSLPRRLSLNPCAGASSGVYATAWRAPDAEDGGAAGQTGGHDEASMRDQAAEAAARTPLQSQAQPPSPPTDHEPSAAAPPPPT